MSVFNPDPTLHIMAGINPNLVVAFNPISVLITTRHPDTFPSFRNPLPANFPVAGGFVNHRRVMIDMSYVHPMGRYYW